MRRRGEESFKGTNPIEQALKIYSSSHSDGHRPRQARFHPLIPQRGHQGSQPSAAARPREVQVKVWDDAPALPEPARSVSHRRHVPDALRGRRGPRLQTSRPRAASWEARAGGCVEGTGGGARGAGGACPETVATGGWGGGASRGCCESEGQAELARAELGARSSRDPAVGGGGSAVQGMWEGVEPAREANGKPG